MEVLKGEQAFFFFLTNETDFLLLPFMLSYFYMLSFPKAVSHAYASLNKSHKRKAKCIKITRHWCLSVKYNHMLIMEYRFSFFPKARCSLAPVEVSPSMNDLFLTVFIHKSSLTSHLGTQFNNPNCHLCWLWNCTSRKPREASFTILKCVPALKNLTLLSNILSLATNWYLS